MIASKHNDVDGFKLQFEKNCSNEDTKFFIKEYPKVDKVAEKRVHCMTCDVHIGTAPVAEKIIRTHPILNVTQCEKCFDLYHIGEFTKGEDGNEEFCRWCGGQKKGKAFCCSTCPFVFCVNCIRLNLPFAYCKEVEKKEEWSCFGCDKEILKSHRAQHWALKNFIKKQLAKIRRVNLTSKAVQSKRMNEDVSSCCHKKRKNMKDVGMDLSPKLKLRPATIKASQSTANLAKSKASKVSKPNKKVKGNANTSSNAEDLPKPSPAPPRSTKTPTCTTFTQKDDGTFLVLQVAQPDTPFGKAKTEFETFLMNSMTTCQKSVNKMIKLSKTSHFRESSNFSQLKGLYDHLRCLLTVTTEEITGLQKSLTAAKEVLSQFDEDIQENDLKIVKQEREVIELSDEEGESSRFGEDNARTPAAAAALNLDTKMSPGNSSIIFVDDDDSSSTIPLSMDDDDV